MTYYKIIFIVSKTNVKLNFNEKYRCRVTKFLYLTNIDILTLNDDQKKLFTYNISNYIITE